MSNIDEFNNSGSEKPEINPELKNFIAARNSLCDQVYALDQLIEQAVSSANMDEVDKLVRSFQDNFGAQRQTTAHQALGFPTPTLEPAHEGFLNRNMAMYVARLHIKWLQAKGCMNIQQMQKALGDYDPGIRRQFTNQIPYNYVDIFMQDHIETGATFFSEKIDYAVDLFVNDEDPKALIKDFFAGIDKWSIELTKPRRWMFTDAENLDPAFIAQGVKQGVKNAILERNPSFGVYFPNDESPAPGND